jgi:hypothetical protein
MDKIAKLKLDLKTLKEKNKKEEQNKDIHRGELTFTPRSFTQSYCYNRNIKNIYEHLYNQETTSWKKYKYILSKDKEIDRKSEELEKILSMNRKWK